MSDQQQPSPTNLDLHREQARQCALLEGMSNDVKEIKAVLLGSDSKPGMVLEVDRLKRSRAFVNAVLWTFFTASVGTGITVLAAYLWPH